MLTDARFRFSLESLKKCILMEPKNNIFFSPHLIYQNLLTVYFAANNDIENSLRQILYIPEDKNNVIHNYEGPGIKQFSYVMNGPENSYTRRIFSRIYISEFISFKNEIKSDTWLLFSPGHQAIINCDFMSNPDRMRTFINNSMSSVTQRNILNLLPPNSIDSKTDLVLANAIYLKGQFEFNLNNDFELDFEYCNTFHFNIPDLNDSKSTKTASQSADKNLNNGKIKQQTVFLTEIPLKQNKISVFFIYPTSFLSSTVAENSKIAKETIIEFMKYLTTEKGSLKFRKLLDSGLSHQNYIFSTFKIQQDLQMNELLEMLGIPELTPSGKVELPGFTNNGCLTLGNAVHRISIDMMATSITATASNAFFTVNSTATQQTQTTNITTDIHYPYICLIYDKTHHNILFCGILWNMKRGEVVMI